MFLTAGHGPRLRPGKVTQRAASEQMFIQVLLSRLACGWEPGDLSKSLSYPGTLRVLHSHLQTVKCLAGECMAWAHDELAWSVWLWEWARIWVGSDFWPRVHFLLHSDYNVGFWSGRREPEI